MRHRAVLVLLTLVLGAGCGNLTGRSMGQWTDDETISNVVKLRLAAMATGRHLPITVDTYERTVYLTGGVQTSDVKRQAEEIALLVPNVALVVNNLHVIRLTPAACAARVLAGEERLARLDVESGTPTWTRYAAYDGTGRRVATVFAVATTELSNDGVRALPVDLPVDHLSVRPDGPMSYVVMWHEAHVEEAATR